MERVQAALKSQLTRQNEKLEIELREKVWIANQISIITSQHSNLTTHSKRHLRIKGRRENS